jgi:hypothetical protein
MSNLLVSRLHKVFALLGAFAVTLSLQSAMLGGFDQLAAASQSKSVLNQGDQTAVALPSVSVVHARG